MRVFFPPPLLPYGQAIEREFVNVALLGRLQLVEVSAILVSALILGAGRRAL